MSLDLPCLEKLELLADRCSGDIRQSLFDCLNKLQDYLTEQQQQTERIAKAQAEAIVNSALMMDKLEEAQFQLIRAQKETNEMKMEAERANAAKSNFLAKMSHEFRTPLNAILGYCEILQEDAEDNWNVDSVSDLKKIHSAGKHLLGLISDILDISKIEAGKLELYPETFDICAMTNELAAIITPLIEKNGNSFEIDIPEDIGFMTADKLRVRQILFNLLSNAGKFTRNSRVLLAIEKLKASSKEQVCFRIQDWGIGIAPEYLEYLFKDFSQENSSTTHHYGGTGLGLSICKKLSYLMKGKIRVESELGKGSLFTVLLPVEINNQPESVEAKNIAD